MGKMYRNIGIGLLIASVLSLIIGYLLPLGMLIALASFSPHGTRITFGIWDYGAILYCLFLFLDLFLIVWGIVLSVILIKNNQYNRQLLSLVYLFIGIKVSSCVLYIPLGTYHVVDIIIGVLTFAFLIYQDNTWSRIMKNKPTPTVIR